MPRRSELTIAEEKVVQSAEQNGMMDFSSIDGVSIRADALADLIRGRVTEEPIRRIRVVGCQIIGELDLGDIEEGPAVHLEACKLETIRVVRSSLRHFNLSRSTYRYLDAERLQVQHDLDLTDSNCLSRINCRRIALRGCLYADGMQIKSTAPTAFNLDGAQVEGDLFLRDARIYCHSSTATKGKLG